MRRRTVDDVASLSSIGIGVGRVGSLDRPVVSVILY